MPGPKKTNKVVKTGKMATEKTIYNTQYQFRSLKFALCIGVFYSSYIAFESVRSVKILIGKRRLIDLVYSASWGGSDDLLLRAIYVKLFFILLFVVATLSLFYTGFLRGFPKQLGLTQESIKIHFDGYLNIVRSIPSNKIRGFKISSRPKINGKSLSLYLKTDIKEEFLLTVPVEEKARLEEIIEEIQEGISPYIKQREIEVSNE